jgi:cytochrome c-type biogenesis protein CcmH/NrfF
MMVAGAAALLSVGCLGQQGETPIEEKAQDINRSLMRDIVVEMLEDGKSKEEILDFFVSRYGEDVLAAPPKSGFNTVVWVMPLLALPVAAVVLVMVLRSMRRRQGVPVEGSPAWSESEEDLEPYLARVDEEMESVLGQPTTDKTPLLKPDEGGGS